MRKALRRTGMLTAWAAAAALSMGTALAADAGVTFANDTSRSITLWTQYGADAACGRLPHKEAVTIAAGQTGTVASGDSKVCYCMVPTTRNTCPKGWIEAKAGSTRRLK